MNVVLCRSISCNTQPNRFWSGKLRTLVVVESSFNTFLYYMRIDSWKGHSRRKCLSSSTQAHTSSRQHALQNILHLGTFSRWILPIWMAKGKLVHRRRIISCLMCVGKKAVRYCGWAGLSTHALYDICPTLYRAQQLPCLQQQQPILLRICQCHE